MSAAALLADLRARGVILSINGDMIAVDAPPGVITPILRRTLGQHKPLLLGLLREEAHRSPSRPPTGDPPGTIRLGDPQFAETVARLVGFPLDHFAEAGALLKVMVSWWPETMFFVPAVADARTLSRAGIARHRIWTARELIALLNAAPLTTAALLTVMHARKAFDGEVVEVRPRERAPSTSQ